MVGALRARWSGTFWSLVKQEMLQKAVRLASSHVARLLLKATGRVTRQGVPRLPAQPVKSVAAGVLLRQGSRRLTPPAWARRLNNESKKSGSYSREWAPPPQTAPPRYKIDLPSARPDQEPSRAAARGNRRFGVLLFVVPPSDASTTMVLVRLSRGTSEVWAR